MVIDMKVKALQNSMMLKLKEAKTSFYLQYMGKEISTEEITKKVHEVWTKEYGKSVEEIKTLNVYLKPEEAAAYYVINEETTGKVTI